MFDDFGVLGIALLGHLRKSASTARVLMMNGERVFDM